MLKLIAIAIIALIIIIKIISIIYSIMKVSRCKHTRYYARCLNCRKDLGFIQYSREKNPQGETGPQRYEFD
jgi:hypothetical protein